MTDLQAVLVQTARDLAESSESMLRLATVAVEATQENARLCAMLRQLEWCDIDYRAFSVERGTYTAHRCPICNRAKEAEEGHAPNCELAALLKEAE